MLIFCKAEEENWVLSGLWIALSLDDEKKVVKEENGAGFNRAGGKKRACLGFEFHRHGLLLMETSSRRGDGQ